MFFKFILQALRFRKQRLLLAFAALAVAATLATVLFGIYVTVDKRIGEEFRAYGANLVAVPKAGNTVPMDIAAAAERLGADASPFLITSGRIQNQIVAVAGFEPDKAASMTTYWHVTGSRSLNPGDCLAGETLARELNLKLNETVALKSAPCTLRGIVATGGAEDHELLVLLPAAAILSGVHDAASLVEIRAQGSRLGAISSSLAASFPAADIRTVRAVAGTESNVVVKVRGVVFLLTLIILLITTLCVSSNFNEMVIERSKEIGILKALGAAERRISAFFLSESAALALAAAVFGYVVGCLAAAAIGHQIFGGAFHLDISPAVFLIVAGVMLAVAGVATAIATAAIRGIQPAVILRGD